MDQLYIGKGESDSFLLPQMANRHGLISGATGTGKTVTLQTLAEGFSRIGVPVFMADVKGDLSGMVAAGTPRPKIAERIAALGVPDFEYRGSPVMFWDVFGEQGHPVRSTVSEMGALLLGRILDLNDTQEGVLQMVFKIADDDGMLLLDLKDLRAMLEHVGNNAAEYKTQYGNVSTASIGAIQRGLLVLEEQGGDRFFGEPALNLDDFLQTDRDGRGFINILAADKLMMSPRVYSTFLLWLLSELFERLPEIGDVEKPRVVFFFDEAHLLFDDAPRALVEKIELVVRLIRSKGVGVYFITQNPLDVPEEVLGQLGNRVQHALRAFTPKDQKAVKSAADTFRPNPKFSVATAITELGVGEALVSTLDPKGSPSIVDRVLICPPRSQIGPVTPDIRSQTIRQSLVYGHYEKSVDRASAYEILRQRAESVPAAREQAPPQRYPRGYPEAANAPTTSRARRTATGSVVNAAVTSAARAIGSQFGRQIIRGILGSMFGGKR